MIRLIKLVSFVFLLSACASTGTTDLPTKLSATPISDLDVTGKVEATIENTIQETEIIAVDTPIQETEIVRTDTPIPVLPTDTPLPATATSTALSTKTVVPSVTQTIISLETESSSTPLPTASTESSPIVTITVREAESPTTTVIRSATSSPLPSSTSIPSPTKRLVETKSTVLPSITAKASPSPSSVIVSSPTATIENTVRGIKCFTPPEEYEQTQIRGNTLSQRTVAMMDNAQKLYGGIGSMYLVIQGSYAPGLGASFGTHDGGGAVDIWTVDPNNTDILLDDIDNMVWALRQSGFAAWFRPANMLYQGMYPHIHAISIGDKELSSGAISQLTGEQGYFRGRNGLPQPEFMGFDPHGGPILCSWMEAQGYQLLPYDISDGESATKTPATEASVTQVPVTKAPVIESPTIEVRITEASTTEIPATEASATETSVTEVPATKVPATEVPATEVLATEVPTTEVPATEVPATEVPATEVPATEVPTSTATSCQHPTDEYRRINVNGQILSQRTYDMLETAQALYGGPGNLLSVTQGSYNQGVTASFGTHDGGGAVDISIRSPQTSEFLYNEVSKMVLSLRQSGFAAWYRSPDEGFTPHIHAIAIGDAELSEAANAQLTGEQGYFRGRNGLLDEQAGTDPHGGPWVCDWMKEMGYRDLR